MNKTLAFLIFALTVFSSNLYAVEWKQEKSQHFVVFYQNSPEDFVKTVEEMAENYYYEISDNLGLTRYGGWTWDDRAKIYIYDNADDYVEEGHQAGWSHGSAMTGEKIIRTFPSAHGFFDSTLPHELGHIILREIVGENARMPHWFEEGVAMYQEKAKRFGANEIVQKAIADGNFIPLKELTYTYLTSDSKREVVDLFYAESASVVYYLISELGDQRFVRLCRELQKGRPFDWAIQDVYGRFHSLDDLNKAWLRYLSGE